MIKKISLILFSISLLMTCSVFAQTAQYETQLIEKIDVIIMNLPSGASFDKGAVLSRIHTKEGDLFSQHEFDNDLKILAQEFDRIEPRVESHNDKIFITLRIWPKPKIRALIWKGNCHVEEDRLQKELGITSCTVFDRLAFNKAFHKIKAYYVKKGFFEAELSYNVRLDELTNEVDIEITINEGRSGMIKDIVFHNFTCEEQDEILECMVTKEWSIFTSWFNNQGTYHDEAVQQDKFAILNYLQNEGYADAKVDVEVREADSCNRIIIHITANKGELYHIGKISFKGNCLFNDEQICSLFTIKEGDEYSPDEIRETISAISTLYGNRGYIDAFVDYEPNLDPDSCSYSIRFTIEEGEQFQIGLIKVFGNCNTHSTTILHEVLFAPGEIFNMGRLQKTEEKLRNVGYFSAVNVYAVKSEADYGCEGNYRDVHIEVEETGTGNFGAFMGYSTVEDLFGGIKITEKNFNYKGIPYVWRDGYRALRGAGEYAHATATIGNKSRSYVFSWTKPFFMDTKWSVGFDVERSSNRYISHDYDINAWGFSLHAKYPINEFVRFGWHYRLRDSDVIVTEDAPALELRHEAKNSGLISASGVSLVYDSRDNLNKPTCGLFSRLQLEFAGLGGETTFGSIAYLNTAYYPLGKKGIIKYRADLKFIQPFGDTSFFTLPIDERFFLGGDDAVRGFRPYAIGPKFPNSDAPMGGITLSQFSGEYDYEITKKIDLFVFADAGSLSLHTWEIDDLKVSVGYGLRFKIFEGGPALSIGMGYPLNAHDKSDVKRFFFTIGARF